MTFQDLDNDQLLVGEIVEFAQPGWGIEKSYFPSSDKDRLAILTQCGTHHIRWTVRKQE